METLILSKKLSVNVLAFIGMSKEDFEKNHSYIKREGAYEKIQERIHEMKEAGLIQRGVIITDKKTNDESLVNNKSASKKTNRFNPGKPNEGSKGK